MQTVITTAQGTITWESNGSDSDKIRDLVANWTAWTEGRNPNDFVHVTHDRGAITIYYRDIVSIDVA